MKTRAQAGRCPATDDGKHRWIETTTKDSPVPEFICGACKVEVTDRGG